MEAIVLAGGLGTRLRSVVSDIPKPMAQVHGRPFLAFVLDRLVDAAFSRVVLAAGYRHEVLRAYFGENYRGLSLAYSVEPEPLGTGGAIRLAWDSIGARDVFVLNGDTYAELDYRAMLAAHEGAGALLTLAVCRVADAGRYGAIEFEGDCVHRFVEKESGGPRWISAGTYVVGHGLRSYLPPTPAFSFERDLLAAQVSAIRPRAFRSDGRFVDIGTPDDYARAAQVLPSRIPS